MAPVGRDRKYVNRKYSFALTSTSFKDLPFLYESRGGSLQISLSRG